MIDVLPGVLEKELTIIREKIDIVSPIVSWVHVDVADNTLVPNETFRNFEEWKGFPEHLSFEAHLMVANPEKYIRPLVDAGFKRLVAHVECQDPRRFLEDAQYENVEVGLALDGPSAVEDLEPFMDEVDAVLLMGIEAGFSGQPFQVDTIEKIRQLLHSYPEALVEIDGGINESTGKLVVDAGAKRLVTTSYLFQHQGTESMKSALNFLSEL